MRIERCVLLMCSPLTLMNDVIIYVGRKNCARILMLWCSDSFLMYAYIAWTSNLSQANSFTCAHGQCKCTWEKLDRGLSSSCNREEHKNPSLQKYSRQSFLVRDAACAVCMGKIDVRIAVRKHKVRVRAWHTRACVYLAILPKCNTITCNPKSYVICRRVNIDECNFVIDRYKFSKSRACNMQV